MRAFWPLLGCLGLFACGQASASSAALRGAEGQASNDGEASHNSPQDPESDSGARLSACQALPDAADTWPTVLKLARSGCTSDDARLCVTVGWSLKRAVHGVQDWTAALPFLECACAANPQVGCNPWATMFDHGHGVLQDHVAARRLYAVACDSKSSDGCTNLAVLFELGRGGAVDLPRARKLFEQACEMGSPSGCSGLGYMLSAGKGGPVDEARALGLYERGCAAGDGTGCSNLGVAFEKGEGRPKDLRRARELYESACKGSTTDGCGNLAKLYERGRGVRKDLAEASRLYQRSCAANERWSVDDCSRLGAMVILKQSAQISLEQAAAYTSAGCDNEHVVGCAALAAYWFQREDREQGERALRRACALGSQGSCQLVEQLKQQAP